MVFYCRGGGKGGEEGVSRHFHTEHKVGASFCYCTLSYLFYFTRNLGFSYTRTVPTNTNVFLHDL